MPVVLLYLSLSLSLFFVHGFLYHLSIAVLVSFSLLFLPFRTVKGGFVPIVVLLLFTFGGNLFFHPGKIIFGAGALSVTDEGLKIGAVRTLRVYSMIYGAKIVTTVLSLDRIIDALKRLLGPLGKIGVPVGEFFSIMGLTVQSFPVLTGHLSKVYREEKGKNAGKGFREGMRHMVSFMMPVFLESIRSPEKFFVSVEDSSEKATGEERESWRKQTSSYGTARSTTARAANPSRRTSPLQAAGSSRSPAVERRRG